MPMRYRSPWSELFGSGETPHNRNLGERTACGEFELNAKECVEAYGHVRGSRYCKDYLEDWYECVYKFKSGRRDILMRNERFKKYVKGELPQYWEPEPHQQSFIPGPKFV